MYAYPGGLQIGGGITADNASEYIRAGASHVIVTSYVFKNGEIYWDNLKKIMYGSGKRTYGSGSELQEEGRKILYRN